ncbi:winged helix-turn-helix domain-containing protein, partial [Streptomyces griseofuscus]
DHGPATASQLAERLGESSGATSYHLRQLADHGVATRLPDKPRRIRSRRRAPPPSCRARPQTRLPVELCPGPAAPRQRTPLTSPGRTTGVR